MNQYPNQPHQLGLYLYRNLQGAKSNADRTITGIAPSSWDLSELEDTLSECYMFKSVDFATRSVVFSYPALFANDFQDLLVSGEYCKQAIPQFFLVPQKYEYPSTQQEPDIVQRYNKALRLIELLKRVADYAVPSHLPDTLVFIGKSKVELTLRFSSEQLRALDTLDNFESEYVSSDMHIEQKKKIIVTAMVDLFKGQTTVEVGLFFLRFNEFYQNVKNSYDLYVADFSYEKVKGEVVKEKVDSIIKINKIFSDIQNQLLAVPIAIVLIGGQLDKTGEYWVKNLLIWCGAFVFTLFMDLLIRNQKNSLKAVEDEVKQHEHQLSSKYHKIATQFTADFTQIKKRISHQKALLFVVDAVVAVAFVAMTYVFLWFNDWLRLFYKTL